MAKNLTAVEDNPAEPPEEEDSPIVVNIDSNAKVTILIRKDFHKLINTAGIAGESPDQKYFILKDDPSEEAQDIIGAGDSMVLSSSDDPPCRRLPKI